MPTAQIPIHSDQSSRLASYSGIPLREDTAFTNHKGVEKGGIRKRTLKAFDKLQDPLRKTLEPDETVLYVAQGQVMPSGIEQAFLGWHAYLLAPAVLVLTNRRLLHILVARNGTWKRSLRNVRWGDLEEAKIKGFLSAKLHVKYRSGKREIYWGLKGGDAKKIKILLSALLPASAGESSSAHGMVNLCPECRSPLTPGVYECGKCHLKFKDEKTALWRSLLIPGGGFFYTGHPFLGMLHLFVDLIILLEFVVWSLVALGLTKPEVRPGETPPGGSAAIILAFILLALLALDKFVTVRVSRNLVRNFIPAA